jgi:hypothetical protein
MASSPTCCDATITLNVSSSNVSSSARGVVFSGVPKSTRVWEPTLFMESLHSQRSGNPIKPYFHRADSASNLILTACFRISRANFLISSAARCWASILCRRSLASIRRSCEGRDFFCGTMWHLSMPWDDWDYSFDLRSLLQNRHSTRLPPDRGFERQRPGYKSYPA